MGREAPVFARMTEAAAGDVEATDFGGHGGDDEDRDERSQNRQSAEIKTPRDQSESAQNFQPGQIKREPDTDRPGQNLVIIDVIGETNRIERFDNAGVNENAADDKI